MSYKLFFVSDTNPNDNCGGGGCVCSPIKQADCKAPYVIFPGNDMENPQSPNVVMCLACVEAAQAACAGEVLAAGEANELKAAPKATKAKAAPRPDDVPRI